jgi:hypothetical protein
MTPVLDGEASREGPHKTCPDLSVETSDGRGFVSGRIPERIKHDFERTWVGKDLGISKDDKGSDAGEGPNPAISFDSFLQDAGKHVLLADRPLA